MDKKTLHSISQTEGTIRIDVTGTGINLDNEVHKAFVEKLAEQIANEMHSLANKPQPKSIRAWLETLDEPYRSQSLKNMDLEDADKIHHSVSDAISDAFYWDDSPEGNDYWTKFFEKLL